MNIIKGLLMSKKLLLIGGAVAFWWFFIRGKATSEPAPYKFDPTRTKKRFIEDNGNRDISAAPRIIVPKGKTAKIMGFNGGKSPLDV